MYPGSRFLFCMIIYPKDKTRSCTNNTNWKDASLPTLLLSFWFSLGSWCYTMFSFFFEIQNPKPSLHVREVKLFGKAWCGRKTALTYRSNRVWAKNKSEKGKSCITASLTLKDWHVHANPRHANHHVKRLISISGIIKLLLQRHI
jgi:hypothetical protein